MEELLNIKLWLEKFTKQNSLSELKELRKLLKNTIKQVDHSLEKRDPKARDPHKRCPECQSNNVRKHGTAPLVRIYCHDCSKAYVVNRQPLYYRRRKHQSILDLIVEIHKTNKSPTEIIQHLGISSKTYYVWRKEILSVFPQLESKFKNRRKK